MQIQTEILQELEDSWLGITKKEIREHKFSNNLVLKDKDKENPGLVPLRLMRNPAYIGYAAKVLLNLDILPLQGVILSEMWNRPFPMLIGSRGLGKTSILAFYSILKMALTPANKIGGPGVKIIVTGSGFRQAKQVFEYVEQVYSHSPLLQSINTHGRERAVSREQDRYTFRLGPNTFIAIPLGNGEKVRGLRANIVIADEMNSIDPVIFDTVIQGFGAVSNNPVEMVKKRAKEKKAKELGIEINMEEDVNNQIIISGTAGYDFEPFATSWKRQKKIIESRGDENKLTEVFPDGPPPRFNWKDFSIIRIPYTLIPDGFLDEKILMRAQATVTVGTFGNEYGAIFSKDSAGFFKRSLIDSCVASDRHVDNVGWPSWCPVPFEPKLIGDKDKKYIIACDPASEVDNFSIVILELWPQHSRVVYSWVTTKKQHKELVKEGMTQENDYYAFAARKIRDLMKAFPCEHIVIDGQGGGIAVMEALHNKNNLKEGEQEIWPLISEDDKYESNYQAGLHYLEIVQFANADWVATANHGLKHDMENKTLLFPRFDQVSIEIAGAKDLERVAKYETDHPGVSAKPFDSFEDVVFDIEALKDELSTIQHTNVGTGAYMRDRWDTPETKSAQGKKGRLRKDRYSALLMANMAARQKRTVAQVLEASDVGGMLINVTGDEGKYYKHAPDDVRKAFEDFYSSI